MGEKKYLRLANCLKTQDCTTKIWRDPKNSYYIQHYLPWAVIKGRGPGISPGYYELGPWLLSKENKRKMEPKETPGCLIPRLLVVFTLQLEILVTTLFTPHTFFLKQIV